MRGNNWVKFFAVILAIAILTYLAAFGADLPLVGKVKSAYDIYTGIDIRGGVDVKLKAITKDGKLPSDKDLDSAKVIIGKRLDGKNILDRYITTDSSKGYIIVQIPAKKGVNPQEAVDYIGKTAKLTFQEVDENQKDENQNYKPTQKIVIEGSEVADASAVPDTESGGYMVRLKLSKSGGEKFAEATGRLVGKPIAIFLDDKFISAPIVNSKITGGEAVIQLNGSTENQSSEAKELASIIKSGALPFSLEQVQVNEISPTLGESALRVIINAGIAAFILVCLFMLGYYRLPGILANIALWGHTVIQLLVISWLGLTMTLPGIAGIILTIGMGVDANVIIFERIKEELRNGKTLRAAIDVGFKRAFTAVLDANMTTLIAAVVLWKFGTGPMVSFAYTLGIGVVLSFLTAVTASRIMLKSVANLDIAKHHVLYGVKGVAK